MSTKVTIGGTRLGAGNRMKEYIPGTGRSTHNMSRTWKSTVAPGLLVPCFKELVLPNDTYKIDIETKIFTLPTLGPMFGSFKFQIDFFYAPFRLYNGALHNNALGIGENMDTIGFAQIQFSQLKDISKVQQLASYEFEQKDFSASSLNHYMGYPSLPATDGFSIRNGLRGFAVHYLMYYDIFKNAYANKQEINAYVMNAKKVNTIVAKAYQDMDGRSKRTFSNSISGGKSIKVSLGRRYGSTVSTLNTTAVYQDIRIVIEGSDLYAENLVMKVADNENGENGATRVLTEFAQPNSISTNEDRTELSFLLRSDMIPYDQVEQDVANRVTSGQYSANIFTYIIGVQSANLPEFVQPTMTPFPLSNIDKARRMILSNNEGYAITIAGEELGETNDPLIINFPPYSVNCTTLGAGESGTGQTEYAAKTPLVGLLCKTYQADIFNAWLNTEKIKDNNTATRVVVDKGGTFSIDSLLMATKMFNLKNYITLAGGTYKDWRLAMWNSETTGGIESPLYIGGLSSEIFFQEVIDQAGGSNPLGSLAGRGTSTNGKGGRVTLKVKEEGLVMGIVSITPRLDYSQGRVWFSELKNMQQLHTPRLDRIGFEDLLSTQVASWAEDAEPELGNLLKMGMGKVPAWIWYQTAYNEVHGAFAEQNNQNFMVLTRDYEPEFVTRADGTKRIAIKDFTTYINPIKYNKIFADASLTAQNFWVQISFKVEARRAMSASLIPQA